MFHQLADLGWVDFDLGSSTVCLILLRQMGFRLNWLSNWASWNLIPPNPGPRADGTPCTLNGTISQVTLTPDLPLSLETKLWITRRLALELWHDLCVVAQFLQVLPAHAQADALVRVHRDELGERHDEPHIAPESDPGSSLWTKTTSTT